MEEEKASNGLPSGLASILSYGNQKKVCQRSHLVSYFDDLGHQSAERTVEYILNLPHKSIGLTSGTFDVGFIRALLNKRSLSLGVGSKVDCIARAGISVSDCGFGSETVAIDNSSICGKIRTLREPLLIESLAVFSSVRSNACVWKGKWMYEVTLETSGVQQLGWATLSCPFTDRRGVGDAEDSYAFDGRRVSKWNGDSKAYGQSWVVGDVIGCCIDLNKDMISFYRNGSFLGVAFDRIRKMGPGAGYYPALSLSEGESCELNFGARPFKYPINEFQPIQAPPSSAPVSFYLFQCLSRLLEVQHLDKSNSAYFEKTRKLKRFAPLEGLFHSISHGISEEFFSMIQLNQVCVEYISWAALLPFLLEVFGSHLPHDYATLDQVIGLFFEFQGHVSLFQHLIMALSFRCKTAPLVLADCPYSGSYPYLAMACHMLKREGMITLWWQSSDFESSLEGFFSMKSPSKQDLQFLIPSVCWPGSSEDVDSQSGMILATTALSAALNKIEEMHRELCCIIIQFRPPTTPSLLHGSVLRTFLQNMILKVRSAENKMSSSDASSNSALVSLYTVILYFLSEGFSMDDMNGLMVSSSDSAKGDGFLHRSGKRKFPIGLFVNADPHNSWISRVGGSTNHILKSHPIDDEGKVMWWEEGCMDDHDTRVTHSTRQKPCCCSSFDSDSIRASKDNSKFIGRSTKVPCTSIPERSITAECSAGSLSDGILDKPSSSEQTEAHFVYQTLLHPDDESVLSNLAFDVLQEEELLDMMLFLYHLGVSSKFRLAFYYVSHQSHLISLLEDMDKQIREKSCIEELKKSKEARKNYHEELIDCVRQCTWFRVSLFSRWKQRGMYATCMWVVEMLMVVSNAGSIFLYVPEYYLESLVDCFHALRKSDPPYVSSAIFIKQGLASFITFLVKHFNDPRILSADVKDILLQSISVLVQYNDYMLAFDSNKEAVKSLPRALLLAFDSRSWIPVTNILLRLSKGSGFGSTKHAESSSSVFFQVLLRQICICDEGLFFSFLNRLFNTLSWTMTEFSVSLQEMQESHQVRDLQQRKCAVVFELSCNLARVLEFYTREIPQAFIQGPDMNLRRLAELIIFILNHMVSVADTEFFDNSLRRPGQYHEKTNRSMIMAPLVGIILNLMTATVEPKHGEMIDIIGVFASMDCLLTVHCGFKYLLGYNWGNVLRGEDSLAKLAQLEEFSNYLSSRIALEGSVAVGDEDDSCCCICYAFDSDAQFEPCRHRSCLGCITRHLLNSQRCFFCNATVTQVVSLGQKAGQKMSAK